MNQSLERTARIGRSLHGERRPGRALLWYYMLRSIATGPGVIVMAPYHFFRYHTLRYVFDDDGLNVRWGILFRREVTLTYARIQDIHLTSNLIERWLGLGRVQIQTASGNATAEVTIEGLPDFEFVRDELYMRMRGARGGAVTRGHDARLITADTSLGDVATALREAAGELRALREELSRERVP